MTNRIHIDNDFLRRSYKTTCLFGGLVVLLLCTTANSKWVLNYSFGVLISLIFFKTTEFFVTQTYRAPHEGKPKRRWFVSLMVGKWVALIAGLYILNRLRYFDGVLLLSGIVTLHTVLALKAFGVMLQNLWKDTRRHAEWRRLKKL